MNTTQECQICPEISPLVEYITLAGVLLTFMLNAFEIYSQKNHELICKSDGCCTFDIIVSDSE